MTSEEPKCRYLTGSFDGFGTRLRVVGPENSEKPKSQQILFKRPKLRLSTLLKVALSQKVVGWFSNCLKCAQNYPGIEKIKIQTFFAFTGLIYLQVLQIGSRSVIN